MTDSAGIEYTQEQEDAINHVLEHAATALLAVLGVTDEGGPIVVEHVVTLIEFDLPTGLTDKAIPTNPDNPGTRSGTMAVQLHTRQTNYTHRLGMLHAAIKEIRR